MASVVIFNLKGKPDTYVVDNGGWCQFLRQSGIWIGNADSFDRTYTVNFPVDAYYNFRGSCDNYGSIYLDGKEIVKVLDYKRDYTGTIFVKAGNHAVRITGVNTGGPRGMAVTIDGDIQKLQEYQNTANSAAATSAQKTADYNNMVAAKASADQQVVTAQNTVNATQAAVTQADQAVAQAEWLLLPLDAITLTTSDENGFQATAGVEADGSVGDEYIGCNARAWVQVSATATAEAGAGLNGNNAYVSAGIVCTVRVEAGTEVNAHAGPVAVDASGCVYAEAGVKANIVVEVGDKGVNLDGGLAIGSCVGAEGSATLTLSGASATAGGGASWGDDHFEAGGGGQAQFSDGHLQLGVSGDVAVMVGLKLDISVDIDTNQAISDAYTAYNTAVQGAAYAEQGYNEAVKQLNNATREAAKYTNQAIDGARRAADDAARFATDSANQAANACNVAKQETEKAFTSAGYTIADGCVKLGNDIANGAVNLGNDIVKVFTSPPKSCVVATELTRQRMWSRDEYHALTVWGTTRLDSSWIGRCLHKGYPVVANHTFIPAIKNRGSFGAKYFKWTFDNGVNMLRGRKYDWRAVPSFGFWIVIMTLVGMFK